MIKRGGKEEHVTKSKIQMEHLQIVNLNYVDYKQSFLSQIIP